MQQVNLNSGLTGAATGGTWAAGTPLAGDCGNIPAPANIADYPNFNTNTGIVTLVTNTPHGIYPFTYVFTGPCGDSCTTVPLVVVNKPIFTSNIPSDTELCEGDSVVITTALTNYTFADLNTNLDIYVKPDIKILSAIGTDVSDQFDCVLDQANGQVTLTYKSGSTLTDGTYTVTVTYVAIYQENGIILQSCPGETQTDTISISCVDPCQNFVLGFNVLSQIGQLATVQLTGTTASNFISGQITWQDDPALTGSFAYTRGVNLGQPYTVSVITADGCVDDLTFTLAGPEIQLELVDGCIIESVVSGGLAPYTYTWQSVISGSVNPAISTQPDLDTNLQAGLYTLTVTDANGFSSQESLSYDPQGIRGTIFYDLDRDGKITLDPDWDAALPAYIKSHQHLTNVAVEIVDDNTNTVVATVFTDASGEYEVPLCHGRYFMRLASNQALLAFSTVPQAPRFVASPLNTADFNSSKLITLPVQGPIEFNSAIGFGGTTAVFTIDGAIQRRLSSNGGLLANNLFSNFVNGGFYITSAISGTVFTDTDSVGTNTGGAVPAGNVRIELWDADNLNQPNNLLASTVSDAVTGEYIFTNIPPVPYFIKLDDTENAPTTKDQSGDIIIDNSIDPVTRFSDIIYNPAGYTYANVNIGLVP